MAKKNGFLLTARKIYSDPLYEEMQNLVKKKKPVVGYYRFQGLQDLFRRANFVESKVVVGNKTKTIERGQVFISVQKLAEEWGWSRNKVSNFLFYLETERDTIRTQKGHNHIIITICKYNEYQEIGNYLGHQKEEITTSKGHQKDIKRTHHKEVKEIKELKEENREDISHIFKHWNSKPTLTTHRELTKVRESAIRSKLKIYTSEEIKQAIDNYYLISKNPVCFYYAWPLENFLKQGNSFDKFLEVNFNIKNHFDFSVKKQVDDGEKQAEIDKRNTLQKIKGMQ